MDAARARSLLDGELRRLEEARRAIASDLTEERGGDGELSTVDQHPADEATETEDFERDLGLAADLAARREELDDAMARLEEGRYGVCERCGEAIPDERLEAFPSTRYCQRDQAEMERRAATERTGG